MLSLALASFLASVVISEGDSDRCKSHRGTHLAGVAANADCTVLKVVDARDVELALESALKLLRRLEKLIITAFFPDTISRESGVTTSSTFWFLKYR